MQSQYLSDLQGLLDCRQSLQYSLLKNEFLIKNTIEAQTQLAKKLAERGVWESFDCLEELIINEAFINWLETLAYKGNIQAQCFLKRIYFRDDWVIESGEDDGLTILVPKDVDKGLLWLSKLAESNMVDAQLELSERYSDINSHLYDTDKATHWLIQAANNNSITAQLNLGNCYANNLTNVDEKRINNRGIYSNTQGYNLSYDADKAEYWLIRAANNADLDNDSGFCAWWNYTVYIDIEYYALYSLGIRYLYGIGLKKDLEKGIYWLKKAASFGEKYEAASIYKELSEYYDKGEYVKKDIQQVEYWLKKAIESEDEDSVRKLNSYGFKFKKALAKLGLYK